jgi:hypothetical protein
MGFITFITACLVILKLAGFTSASWLIVAAPFLAWFGAVVVVSFVAAVVAVALGR